MADVRKEGPNYRTLRRLYQDKGEGYGRTLLYPEGKLVKPAEVTRLGLTVADDEKPAPKGRKPKK